MKDCKDCQHRYWSGFYQDYCCDAPEAQLSGAFVSLRCNIIRKPEWPCGPEAKYYKDKRDI
jgi:hypothetical protein